jgi:hypothetical protein
MKNHCKDTAALIKLQVIGYYFLNIVLNIRTKRLQIQKPLNQRFLYLYTIVQFRLI